MTTAVPGATATSVGDGGSCARETLRTPPRVRRALTVAASAAGATLLTAILAVRDPHVPGSFATCPSVALTGTYCPGCGSLRGIHDLAAGHPLEAAGHNLLLVPALVWLTWWWVTSAAAAAGIRVPGPPTSARFCYALLTVVAVFTVARNLPGSPLAP